MDWLHHLEGVEEICFFPEYTILPVYLGKYKWKR
jgi:hypothetical protein